MNHCLTRTPLPHACRLLSASLVVAAALVAGCSENEHKDHKGHHSGHHTKHHSGHHAESMMAAPVATATLRPAANQVNDPVNSKVTGTVTVRDTADGVEYAIMLEGLPPNATRGFHVHEKGDLSAPDLTSAGPHWDPLSTHQHGGPHDMASHGGDLGNVTSDANGRVSLRVTRKGYKAAEVVGKSVILHAGADDLKSNPAGNSGDRVAGGVLMRP